LNFTAKHLVGYSGFGARVHASGKTNRSGGITKQGRELRAVLIEAAHAAIQSSPFWRRRFERLAARIGAPKATVAIAYKLLVIIWQVLRR
jgi:transposase